jgi:aminopeptidase YwaD
MSTAERALEHLNTLCRVKPNRRVGSRGNREATRYFAGVLQSLGYSVSTPEFDCIDWIRRGIRLTCEGETYLAHISPYSQGCQIEAPLVLARTLDELEQVEAAGNVLLLSGELTKEQLMPKNFTFYNPELHQRINRLLEEKSPGAIIAATSRDPGLAGGMYPFPLIEDGDFDIPSAFMTDLEGGRLAACAGKQTFLEMDAERIHAKGWNVSTLIRGRGADQRIVVCAHIDAKDDTPGALDNATGTVILLLLAELLKGYRGQLGVEITALNGEDYYSAPGEMLFMQENEGRFEEIHLGINMDGAGYIDGATAYSLYGCTETQARRIHECFSSRRGMIEGEPWYQSDHSIFIQNERPALALTSELFMDLTTNITHTPKDSPELVDAAKLAEISLALRDIIYGLDTLFSNTS